MVKPVFFKDQEVRLETRDSVTKGHALPWLEAPEVKDKGCRLCFTDVKTKRVRALYFEDVNQALTVRDNAII